LLFSAFVWIFFGLVIDQKEAQERKKIEKSFSNKMIDSVTQIFLTPFLIQIFFDDEVQHMEKKSQN